MRKAATALLCLTAICATGMLVAQDPPHEPDFPSPQRPTAPVYVPGQSTLLPQGNGRRFFGTGSFGSSDRGENRNEMGKIQVRIEEATGKLTSENADERESATGELEAAVTELFELRAKERLKQIEELEQRIAKLREQMERREEKKSEIIQLQVQTYINQANGLGF